MFTLPAIATTASHIFLGILAVSEIKDNCSRSSSNIFWRLIEYLLIWGNHEQMRSAIAKLMIVRFLTDTFEDILTLAPEHPWSYC